MRALAVAAVVVLAACGGDERPSREAFVEKLEQSGADDELAGCIADATYDGLSGGELDALMAVGDVEDADTPAVERVDAAALECLMP